MTLEDFFTLTEMNNGLTAPSRVRELMAVMQKERDCTVKNAADLSRHWSAVASAIAATENKDCLDLFNQLNGFHFISKWLKDAVKFNNTTLDGLVEESITHLLRAIKKVCVEYENLVASEIWVTVQDLLVHSNLKVQDEARALFESYEKKRDCDETLSESGGDGTGKSTDLERVLRDTESGEDSVSTGTSVEEDHDVTRNNQAHSTNPDAVQSVQVEDAQHSDKKLDPPIVERPSDQIGSPSLPMSTGELPSQSVGAAIGSCSAITSRLDTLDDHTKLHDKKSPSYQKQSVTNESPPPKLGLDEESKKSDERNFISSPIAVSEMMSAAEINSRRSSIAKGKNSCDESLLKCNSYGKKVAGDNDDVDHHRLLKGCNKNLADNKDLGRLLSGNDDGRKVNIFVPNNSVNDLASNYNVGKKQMNRKPGRVGNHSGVNIDYGLFDPLEVAMKVAIEVEREFVDSAEQSCSSSEKSKKIDRERQGSLDQSHISAGSHKEEANAPNFSEGSSPLHQESSTSSGNLDEENTYSSSRDMPMSQISKAAQQQANLEKGLCDFDLNEEVWSEDADHPENQNSTPISVVSASKAAAAPGLPGAPLQFQGKLGWKGSAATSAFRPASPRRMPESDKDSSTGGRGRNSKQPMYLDFDLNVGESVVTRKGDASSDKQGNAFSNLPSGESSVEMNSRKSEHLELDLNRVSEDVGAQSDWQIGQFFPQGSHSHSSSSSKQPMRNINLNDQPSFLNNSSDNCHLSIASQNFKVSGSTRSDESVISILGTRVEVNRNDYVSRTPAFLNSRASELAFDANMGRTGHLMGIGSAIPYAHSSVYGYNNVAPGPTMPFSSTIYGSGGLIPTSYMVDSRGAPVIPHIVGSASALPAGFSQPPFFVTMNGAATPPNGIKPWQSSHDMNAGILGEGGSKDSAVFGLFLNSAPIRSADEHLKSHSQPTMSSTVSGKRKEPDNGWEHYPYKPHIPPWKPS